MKILCGNWDCELRKQVSEVIFGLERQIDTGELYEIKTSGTTGAPKTVFVDLVSALDKKKRGKNERWLLTYSPTRWAGVSVILHAFAGFDSWLVVPNSLSYDDIITACCTYQPTQLSLTPSVFRNILRSPRSNLLKQCGIAQVTFGGEYATQAVLDLSHNFWPNARVTHVYASTEFGDILAVSDGLEGIPETKFDDDRFWFDAGELYVDGRSTGDVWKHDDLLGRYHFLGRKEEIINVGGVKISPQLVERWAVHFGADEARAYAVVSPLLGQVVGLEYAGNITSAEMRQRFKEEPMVQNEARPAIINKVTAVALTQAGKIKRL